jgi:O-antigen/teichoic acid export membrane protein
MYAMSLKLMLLLALPIAAVTALSGGAAGAARGRGGVFAAGAIALQIVIWSIPLGWMNSVTNYVLISLGLERKQPRAFTVAVLFNIIANLIFIPRYSYVAAGVTTILSEVVLLGLFDYYLRQRMPGLNWLQMAWRPVVVTAVMLVAMWLGRPGTPGLGAAAGRRRLPGRPAAAARLRSGRAAGPGRHIAGLCCRAAADRLGCMLRTWVTDCRCCLCCCWRRRCAWLG